MTAEILRFFENAGGGDAVPRHKKARQTIGEGGAEAAEEMPFRARKGGFDKARKSGFDKFF